MTAIPAVGLPMLRAWHGDHLKRGGHVEFRTGGLATVLSAQGARVAVREFGTNQRLVVLPAEIGPVQ